MATRENSLGQYCINVADLDRSVRHLHRYLSDRLALHIDDRNARFVGHPQ